VSGYKGMLKPPKHLMPALVRPLLVQSLFRVIEIKTWSALSFVTLLMHLQLYFRRQEHKIEYKHILKKKLWGS
jgi:hypothetical protein